MRNAIAQRGLILVGWYHSHPSYQPDPSVQDIHNQLKYQSILQQENTPYGPCLGIIVCKYFTDLKVSQGVHVIGEFYMNNHSYCINKLYIMYPSSYFLSFVMGLKGWFFMYSSHTYLSL